MNDSRDILIERSIGTKFIFNDKKYEVVPKSGCYQCDFKKHNSCLHNKTYCAAAGRSDNKAVMYKLVKENKMKKPIFENEEAFNNFWIDMHRGSLLLYDHALNEAKRLGYIKKSWVEEAEELYRKYNPNVDEFDEQHVLIETMHWAIEELKEKLKEK